MKLYDSTLDYDEDTKEMIVFQIIEYVCNLRVFALMHSDFAKMCLCCNSVATSLCMRSLKSLLFLRYTFALAVPGLELSFHRYLRDDYTSLMI